MSKTNKKTPHIGMKWDTGKLRWELLPWEGIEQIVRVLTYGANKYAANNWMLVDKAKERYYAALMRHLTAWKKGEYRDPESGIPHLAHVGCNLVFLMHFEKKDRDAVEKIFKAIYNTRNKKRRGKKR